jgi:nucleoside-diphosphate-sugar epimerase
MKILILGGTGFIGRHLVMNLTAAGHEVAVFHRGTRAVALPSCVVHILGNRKRLRQQKRSLDTFAARVVVDLIAFNEADAKSTIEFFADRSERLVCASSMDVYRAYGSFRRLEKTAPATNALAEDAPLRTVLFPYRDSASKKTDLLFDYEKILVERVVTENSRLPSVVLRLPQVFGPHDAQHRLRAYLKRMDAGEDIIMGDAKARWRWTRGYVEDIAAGFALAIAHPNATGRIYNIGEQKAATELDWIGRIGRTARWRGRVKVIAEDVLPANLAEPYDWRHHLVGDTARIRHELGYREQVSAGEAMKRSVDWERSI